MWKKKNEVLTFELLTPSGQMQQYEVNSAVFGKKPLEHFQEGESFSIVEYRLARRFMLIKLSRRSYLCAEVEKVLKEHLVSEQTRYLVIEKLLSDGYLNDANFLEAFVEGQKNRGKGPGVIQQKLHQKGLAKNVADETLSAICSEEEQKKSIQKLLQRQYRNYNLQDPKEKRKVVNSLIRKGYSYSLITSALKLPEEEQWF